MIILAFLSVFLSVIMTSLRISCKNHGGGGWQASDCNICSYNLSFCPFNVNLKLLLNFVGTTCGSVSTQPSGIITSPNYPDVYNNRLFCIYLVRIHNARSVTFYFTDFTTEIFKDSLEYGVGGRADFNTALGLYEGNLTDQMDLPDPVTLDGSQSWFLFSTDRNIQLKGFELVYFAGELGTSSSRVLNLYTLQVSFRLSVFYY